MRLIASGRRAFSALTLCALTACGGGGDSASGNITAKDGELIMIDSGDSAVAAKSYTLETSYQGVTRRSATSFGTVVEVYPENGAFDTSVAYLEGNPNKFLVGFWANATNNKTYGCRSSAWSGSELNAVAALLKDSSIPTSPVCAQSPTIDPTNRRITYDNLRVPSDEGGTGAVVISANFTWPAP
jgi:hypothetical protein